MEFVGFVDYVSSPTPIKRKAKEVIVGDKARRGYQRQEWVQRCLVSKLTTIRD